MYCYNVLFFITELEIMGFIEIGDIASPPVLSRHLVLPIAVNKGSHFTTDSLLFTSIVFHIKMLISAFVFALRGRWSGSRSYWWNGRGDANQSDGRKEPEFLCPSAWQSKSGRHGGPCTAGVRTCWISLSSPVLAHTLYSPASPCFHI